MYSLCWTVAGALLVVVSAAACDRATDPGAQVAQVTVSPARAALVAGDTIHLAAVALDAGGRTRDSVRVRWEVSDTAVALIDSTGVVFGRRGGGVSVRASAGQAYGDAALEVRGPPPGWTGFDVVCGIWKDSNAYCWNWPTPDQTPTVTPAISGGGTGFILIAHGDYRWCALSRDHRAYCWGDNDFGQLGNGTTESSDVPVPVAGGLTFDSLAMGPLHTCGLTRDGQAYCWGAGAYGQLGVSPAPDTCLYAMPCAKTPVRVPFDTPFAAVTAGGPKARLGPLASSNEFTCAMTAAGTVYCWGANSVAELGDGTYSNHARPAPVQTATRFTGVAAGGQHTCAIAADGRLFCWGMNSNGELGFDTDGWCPNTGDVVYGCATRPGAVLSQERFRAVDAGDMTTCGITRLGRPFCWGDNWLGEIGAYPQMSANRPMAVPGARTYLTVRVGSTGVCAQASDGRLDCWGGGRRIPTAIAGP